MRAYMDAAGVTVAEASKRTGLSRAFIYMILNGQNEVGLRSVMAFKAGLGISLDKWASDGGEKNNVKGE